MNLQGRNLYLRMRGEDVELLQSELRRLGFSIDDAEGYFGKATRRAVLQFQEEHELEPTGVVDESTAGAINATPGGQRTEQRSEPFTVMGRVVREGEPLAGAIVRAFDREVLLGEATTDEEGHYGIRYTPDRLTRAEKRNADLVVRVGESEAPLAASEVLFRAGSVETINLVVPRGEAKPSEYERIEAALGPLTEDVHPADLAEEDVAFLAEQSRLPSQRVRFYAEAQRLHREHEAIPPAAFYGVLRRGHSAEPTALATQHARDLESVLDAAVRENLVPADLAGELGRVAQGLQTIGREHLASSLGRLLDTSPASLPQESREKVVELHARHGGSTEEFWHTLGEDPDLVEAGVAEELRHTMALADLTGENVPMVAEIQGMRPEGEPLARVLARLEESEWRGLVERSVEEGAEIPPDVPGETQEERFKNHARRLAWAAEDAYPTAFVAEKTKRPPAIDAALARKVFEKNPELDPSERLPEDADLSGFSDREEQEAAVSTMDTLRREARMFPALAVRAAVEEDGEFRNPVREGVARFFEEAPDFDLRSTPVDSYLEENAPRVLPDADQHDVIANQVKPLQRIYQVAPRYDQTSALLGEGLDSALSISSLSDETFVQQFQSALGGEDEARQIHANARQMTATATNLFATVHQAVNDVTPRAMGGSAASAELLRQIPDWATLFGRVELCDCAECRSVYGPAAYLVDLLQFLNPKALPQGVTQRPIELLLRRRSDLEHIELTCENTNTTLPYVDLVNEVLEDVIAPQEFSVVGNFSATQNPSGAWSYGYQASAWSGFALYNTHDKGYAGLDRWSISGSEPMVACNRTGQTASYLTITHPPDVLNLHPGSGGAKSVVRWTAPSSGTVRIEGRFQGIDTGGTSTDVAVVHKSATLFSGNINGYDARAPFSINKSVAARDTIEFSVGYGSNRTYSNDSTGLSITITYVAPAYVTARQTRGTSEELSVNPEYTNAKAYEQLSQAVFPFSLPYDLNLETTRTYLGHLGTSRHELMTVFEKALQDDGSASALDRASEYLSLSLRERNLIAGSQAATGVHEFYGYEAATPPTETISIEDQLPKDSKPREPGAYWWGTQDPWEWVTANPTPISGSTALRSALASGVHGHVFTNATEILVAEPGDRLYVHLYLDPQSPPYEVMLEWYDGTSWAHCAYWGEDVIDWGEETKGRQYMGPLPSAGKWVRLEVAAGQVGLENHTIHGMTFALHGGRASWDCVGKRSASWHEYLARVPEFLNRTGLNFDELLDLLATRFVNPNPVAPTVVLRPYRDPCDLGTTVLNDLTANDYAALKNIHRFVRLWRKLGGPMSDLDKAISTLGGLSEEFIVDLAEAKRLQTEFGVPLVQLLSLWSNLDTHGTRAADASDDTRGADALYTTLFQNKAVFSSLDPDFALTPDRSQVAGTSRPLDSKTPVLLAALRLSSVELAAIRDDAGLAASEARLSLANLSTLHRYALLARTLDLSVRDLLSLKKLAGFDPFASPGNTLAFVETVRKVRVSGFSVALLDYLLRDIAEPTTGLSPAAATVDEFVRSLKANLTRIAEENAPQPDPTGERLRRLLSTVLEPGALQRAMQFVDGVATYTASLNTLPNIGFPDDLEGKVFYHSDTRELSFAGAMTETERTRLLGLSTVATYRSAVERLFQQPRSFIDDYLTFLPGTEARTLLFAPLGADPDATRQQRRSFVSGHLLAYQRDVQSRASIVQSLGSLLNLEAPAITSLLEEILKAQVDPSKSAMHDFLALGGPGVGGGLSATYFDNADLTGASVSRIDPTVNFSWGTSSPAPGIGPETFSVRWTGKVLAAHSETYTFYTTTNDGVRLWIDGQKLIDNWQAQGETKNQATISLQAGRLHDIAMEFRENSDIAAAKLLWSSISTPKAPVPQSHLFSGSATAPYKVPLKSYYRLHKIALLVTAFGMTPEELRYLAEHSAEYFNLDLNRLPLDGEPTDLEVARLFDGWVRLSELFTVKRSLPASEKTLLDVFEAAKTAGAILDGVLDTLAAATGWNRSDLGVVCGSAGLNLVEPHLFLTANHLTSIQSALALGRRLGVPSAQIVSWATSTADAAQVKSIKETVKAKYDEETWLRIAAPLSDELRERQKAALIAYVLQQPAIRDEGITDSNQLFEYFLIDVEMTACMKTSRIKQAISSVQLFVQRCQLNLEPGVPPEAINGDQWKWMKNYRLWEANRKVFLNPENWIEPELRDDKTPFFRELETELLQNEVTAETAQSAYVRYLEKLNEVAYLEICGFWFEWHGAGKSPIIHLFARTFAAPHVYYYRRSVGEIWTAWEKVDLDIQGDHLSPGMLQHRLFLFWPIFERITVPQEQEQGSPPNARWDIKLAWSEYKKGQWSASRVSSQSLRSPEILENVDDREDKLRYRIKAGQGLGELYIPAVEGLGSPSYNAAWERHKGFGAFIFSDARNTLDLDISDRFMRTSEGHAKPPNTHIAGSMRLANAGVKDLKLTSYDPIVEHTVLQNTPTTYRVLNRQAVNENEDPSGPVFSKVSSYPMPLVLDNPFFYLDRHRAYLVQGRDRWSDRMLYEGGVRFFIHYHPHATAFLNALNAGGIPGLLTLENQQRTEFGTSDKNVTGMAFRLYGGSATWDRAGKVGKLGEETIWVEDDLPAGATGSADVDEWKWVSNNPAPFSGTRAHQSTVRAGLHWHYFTGATDTLVLNRGDKLFAYVYLDPANVPEEVMLEWYVGGWEQRAYWGANKILLGQDGTASRRYLGPLPKAGEWVRLEVPASTVSLPRTTFAKEYQPQAVVHHEYPEENVAFEVDGAYSLYNWELFFHGPLFIADRLSKEQRFDEAQRWFHYVFDPTNDSPGEPSPQRYWRFRPFNDKSEVERIQELLRALADPNGDDKVRQEMQLQVAAWRNNPFQPHLIARQRLGAYQKTVVMKYIDNLIAWGDQLFRRDTIESINEATLLYVLAHDLLGPRPERIPELSIPAVKTYQDLQSSLDDFSNALVDVQNRFPFVVSGSSPNGSGSSAVTNGFGLGQALYFGIPRNDRLISYWDKVEDRLFKVRHCLNIEGVRRSLALFEPPIEPSLLVRAAAAGVDLGSALSDLNAPLGHYRFSYLLPKALELCAEVKSLGGALLSALEKKDAETLSNLRARQESLMLRLVCQVRERQIEEAKTTLEGLRKTRAVTEFRYNHYKNIAFMNPFEMAHLALLGSSAYFQTVGQMSELAASVGRAVPEVDVGVSGAMGSPVVKARYGGSNIGGALEAFGKFMNIYASLTGTAASMSSTMGGHQRRAEEWKLQEELASRELEQIDRQIAGAEIRLAIADFELKNHARQVANAEEVDAFLREKYTNQELYAWMSSQLSSFYFQTYQLAYDAAKRAEKAFRFERGLTSSNFVQFGYWDSLKKGLLAGERLHVDLKRLEMAYLDQNAREYELTKQVSLVLHDPIALISLKETGRCRIELPEAMFDMDHPGHFMRRIKSVSITIPSVAGPYAGINATLTLLSSRIRTDSGAASPYEERSNDGRFLSDFSATQSIATSHANNDAGLFELNFRDERYLPFEGAGAVSEWRLDLPKETNAFDLNTISDVVLRINYTAREGGDDLRREALKAATLPPTPQQDGTTGTAVTLPAQENLGRLFSAKHEFPGEWHRFLYPQDADDEHVLRLDLTAERFPFRFRGRQVTIDKVDVFLSLKDARKPSDAQGRTYSQIYAAGTPVSVTVTPSPDGIRQLRSDPALGGMPDATGVDVGGMVVGIAEQSALQFSMKSADIAAWAGGLDDLLVVCHYSVSSG